MKPFTKLFASITSSSIWRAPDHVRLVWITLLAMADKDGEVWASVGGLADLARVSVADCSDALRALKSPDDDSRTKEYEGRRIEDIDGGWRLLNYVKYRALGRSEDRREYFAEQKRKKRAEQRCPPLSTPVTTRPPKSPIAEAEAEGEAEAEEAGAEVTASSSSVSKDWLEKELKACAFGWDGAALLEWAGYLKRLGVKTRTDAAAALWEVKRGTPMVRYAREVAS